MTRTNLAWRILETTPAGTRTLARVSSETDAIRIIAALSFNRKVQLDEDVYAYDDPSLDVKWEAAHDPD